ncbi:Acetyltransferase (GNAT) family protein [Phyllobacterium sp. YR620]|uniref:GNAT family N-acetyltransferase n=1 Tax=Phyllobacterium pellucidum TaxID=2740464 RepID=A0A849W1N5_9HYPH|nr:MULTISPECIES: GNAT family N-acetyltransferase [Phyllobacterium]MRG55434.1 GNAT family N-acetyltransferase [Phyllobacterium sp. SYP-B3895]NTS33980.1 GNAT family N-acetyltransferase [Phyllobacterium pellucidum]UGY08505.1 GNAT family N-acetyltransferase [Phyllobacterium sp. T1018]SDP14964.1 Acetyltransferase (GNAT) family protein [Phyllobacterium sp. YR620]SFJ14020.1 Acetyltransferase (GNAT) domain-containing protein [Phyllobacterium sp. CL33Tsu]
MQHEDPEYQVQIGTPSVEDYRRLRDIAGLSSKSQEAAERGLPNTVYAATVQYQSNAVAMGRIIGDGGCFFQVVDIAVDPAHQGKGLGKIIVSRLVDYLQAEAPDGAYVSLIADGPAKYLYAKFGFRPVMPESIGMAIEIRRPSEYEM